VKQRLITLAGKLLGMLPDKPFIYLFYYRHTGEFLSLRNPQRFTHKIQWLKLHGNLEQFARYADKYTVREYVEDKVGAQHLVPLLGVWDDVDTIPFEDLPQRFVLKVTQGCGYNYICKDKSAEDIEAVKAKLRGWLREDFYKQEREPQYRDGKARIICEKYLENESGSLNDYKFWCSKGEPQIVQVDTDRFTDHKSGMMDLNWQPIDHSPSSTFSSLPDIPRPKNLDAMVKVARTLSADFPFVRVDLYTVGLRLVVAS
jgi:hypothetical protein